MRSRLSASVGEDVVRSARRSPVTTPGYFAGCAPANEGMRYLADSPRVEEIIAVMRKCGTSAHGLRMRALIVVLWRAGLRISEALAVDETDLDVSIVRRSSG